MPVPSLVGASSPSSQDLSVGFVAGVGVAFETGASPGVAAAVLVGSVTVVIVSSVGFFAKANGDGLDCAGPNGEVEGPNGECEDPNGEGLVENLRGRGAVLDVGGSGPCGSVAPGAFLIGGGAGACCLGMLVSFMLPPFPCVLLRW